MDKSFNIINGSILELCLNNQKLMTDFDQIMELMAAGKKKNLTEKLI